jgi:hypothetical protein
MWVSTATVAPAARPWIPFIDAAAGCRRRPRRGPPAQHRGYAAAASTAARVAGVLTPTLVVSRGSDARRRRPTFVFDRGASMVAGLRVHGVESGRARPQQRLQWPPVCAAAVLPGAFVPLAPVQARPGGCRRRGSSRAFRATMLRVTGMPQGVLGRPGHEQATLEHFCALDKLPLPVPALAVVDGWRRGPRALLIDDTDGGVGVFAEVRRFCPKKEWWGFASFNDRDTMYVRSRRTGEVHAVVAVRADHGLGEEEEEWSPIYRATDLQQYSSDDFEEWNTWHRENPDGEAGPAAPPVLNRAILMYARVRDAKKDMQLLLDEYVEEEDDDTTDDDDDD